MGFDSTGFGQYWFLIVLTWDGIEVLWALELRVLALFCIEVLPVLVLTMIGIESIGVGQESTGIDCYLSYRMLCYNYNTNSSRPMIRSI